MHVLASLPSPTHSVWHLGPLPVRAYALCIILGIIVAISVTNRRWRARGGDVDHVWDVAGWAIVFGIIGARIYHVATDPELYFDKGKHPLDAFKIWDGGLGIWGAVALGALGAWIGCRRRGIRLSVFADAAAPGIVFAQGIGRLGNWFNNELYGGPTRLPWGLRIHCIDVGVGHAVAGGQATGGEACAANSATLVHLYQPTFLYELIWDIALGIGLILLDRRLRLGRGNVFLLYVMGYTAGRSWIEALRSDPANHFLGLRLNDWTCIIVFAVALVCFVRNGGFGPRPASAAYFRAPTPTRKQRQAADAAPGGSADEPSGADADDDAPADEDTGGLERPPADVRAEAGRED